MNRPFIFLPLLFIALRAAAAPVPIFDGKTLEGWDYDPKIWRIEEGMITGGSTTEKITANYFIATKKSYANFELRLKIKCSGDPATGMINSGIQIRSVRVPGGAHMSGYQVDCGKGWFGKIYDEFRRNRVIATPVDAAALGKVVDVFGWNEYRIRAEGPRIQTWINGVLAIDYTEQDKNIALDGQIAPQVHSGGVCLVQVKDATIDELPPTPGAPTWESLGGVEAARGKIAPPKKQGAGVSLPPAPKPGEAALQKRGPRDISYNAVQTVARTPEEERASFKVPAGFEVELVAAEDPANGIGKFVPIAFDQRGALWTTTALEYPVDGNENPAAADALYASKAKDKVLVYDRDPKSPTGYASQPRVFADGLAIPLGVLPYKAGCYVQHGHDIVFLEDTNADGQADRRTVILTGFGVQDSHLFPHQFLRAPGGWIWMAQGLFNKSAVKTSDGQTVEFDMCRMAKFRPDGTQFEPTSVGPNNIWGLVLNGEGEAFIQEANDYGYPVMPFHEYACYPGGADRLAKSYQPPFPHTADFRMGGTGLSGLAILDEAWARLLQREAPATRHPERSFRGAQAGGNAVEGPLTISPSGEALTGSAPPLPTEVRGSSQTVLVANPITNRIQAIKMHRDGPRWRLEQIPDFLVSEDPWFRPVAIAVGPDGCLYIVDWYNKIISHNEVPRAHPDRDKTRGRIWRVKAKAAQPFDVPDFTKLSGDKLIAKLGGESLAQSHLAWQALTDNGLAEQLIPKLEAIIRDKAATDSRRIQAQWALEAHSQNPDIQVLMSKDADDNVRREAVRSASVELQWAIYEVAHEEGLRHLANDPDPTVRAELIRKLGRHFDEEGGSEHLAVRLLTKMALPPLDQPTAPSSRGGKPIKVREAYEREFERYLVRMFLERQPDAVAKFLDSDAAKPLPIEARLLASLALEPQASAARVAKLLPQLQRAPGPEEVLRLAQFPDEPGVGEALKAILQAPATRIATLEALLATRTKLDEAKLAPFLSDSAKLLLSQREPEAFQLGIKLAEAFRLSALEKPLVAIVRDFEPVVARDAVRALAALGSMQTELFAKLADTAAEPALREEALAALAGSKAPDAAPRTLALFPKLTPAQRRSALDKLSATKPGALSIVAAVSAGTLPKSELDAAALDRLQTVLGENDPALAELLSGMSAFFRPVLALDGTDAAWTQTDVTLDGPCTIEAWVRLDPEKRAIGNADGLFGAPGQLDINFYGERPRVYAFPPLGDVVAAKKPVMPGLWTHVAATRDAAGIWKLYLDGELEATATQPAPGPIEKARIGWTAAKNGPRGALAEFRIWNGERTAGEIRAKADRSLAAQGGAVSRPPPAAERPPGGDPQTRPAVRTPPLLVFSSANGWGQLQAGAKVSKTSDLPPILSADEAAALDAKYAKFRALAGKPGDVERGKAAAALCQACHLFGNAGGNIGPNLSGVGAMGAEAILRNLLTPNAAMEAGYRIFRVELKSGDIVDAFFVSEDKDAVVIRQPGLPDRRLARTEIARTQSLRRSLMPEGLLDALPPEQVSDLFAYLMSLK